MDQPYFNKLMRDELNASLSWIDAQPPRLEEVELLAALETASKRGADSD